MDFYLGLIVACWVVMALSMAARTGLAFYQAYRMYTDEPF